MDTDRVERINNIDISKNVLYIMRRDQRIHQNHSVELAYTLSYELKSQLFIGLELEKLKINVKQRQFILEGLSLLYEDAKKYYLEIEIINNLKDYLKNNNIGTIIVEYSPLRESLKRLKEIEAIAKNISILVCDSHNIVPCKKLVKYKRTSKAVKADLYSIWHNYLTEFKVLEPHKYNKIDFEDRLKDKSNGFLLLKDEKLKIYFKPGYKEAMKTVDEFFKFKFDRYSKFRNDPDENVLSNLSPYLNTGQISAQQIIMMANEKFAKSGSENYECFVNEMFVWRETSEHFVRYEPDYDNINGALPWAKKTLIDHSSDERKQTYTRDQLEHAETTDDLWNSAQKEMVVSGKMHGYVRMYWAKKLLSWIKDPKEALKIGIEFNDKYSIDGNDPNGYLGVMWCICGTMDRAFGEREIFGKIRPMKAFNCPLYIQKWNDINLRDKKYKYLISK